MTRSKPPVEWNRAEPVMLKTMPSREKKRTSKCGRFVVVSRRFNSCVDYVLRDNATGELRTCHTLADARFWANATVEPTWED